MSVKRINASELGDKEFFKKLEHCITELNSGNDRLEITMDIDLSETIINFIKQEHLYGINKNLVLYYGYEDYKKRFD